jgi:AraC-like DNA-binding protein
MPFAPAIRKNIFKVLEEKIIPALESQKVPQVLAEPPFDFSCVKHEVLKKRFLEDKEHAPLQSVQSWKSAMVMSTNVPTFMFAYEGICYERVGITKKQARQLDAQQRKSHGGVNLLQLPAPSLLCHPAFMLRSLGAPRPESLMHSGRALMYRLTKNGIWISLNARGAEEESVTHPLEINDAALVQMGMLYMDELRSGEQTGAQALQLALLYHLKRYLLHHRPAISNSSWVTPSDDLPSSLSSQNKKLCRDATEFIVTHLHSPLTLKDLANYFTVSTVHLNHIFKQAKGTTVMRYVTQLRIEAAKAILRDSSERINDVADLVGFSSAASFGLVFRNYTGLSPREFRQRSNQKK